MLVGIDPRRFSEFLLAHALLIERDCGMFIPPQIGSGPGGAPMIPQPAPGRGDSLLIFHTIPVFYQNGVIGSATSEGNNASWMCICARNSGMGTVLPLLGRCYYAFGHICHSNCVGCGTTYRVWRNPNLQAIMVVQIGIADQHALALYASGGW